MFDTTVEYGNGEIDIEVTVALCARYERTSSNEEVDMTCYAIDCLANRSIKLGPSF